MCCVCEAAGGGLELADDLGRCCGVCVEVAGWPAPPQSFVQSCSRVALCVAGTNSRDYNVAAYKCIIAPKFVVAPMHRNQLDFPGKVRERPCLPELRECVCVPRAVPLDVERVVVRRASSCFEYSSARRSAASTWGFFEVEDPIYDADTMRKRREDIMLLLVLLLLEKTARRRRFRSARSRSGRWAFFGR